MRTRKAFLAAALVTALAACSQTDNSGTAPSTAAPSTTAPASTSSASPAPTSTAPTTSATPKPTRTPTAPKPAPPKAADGYNYAACRDARCEVYVKTGSRIPVKRSVAGFSTLVVTKVSPTGVDFGGSTANTSVSAGGQQPGFHFRLNNLTVVTVAITHPQAILRLTAA